MGHARISGNVVRLHSAKPVGPVHAALATATGDATIRVLYLTDDDPPTWVDVSGARRDPVESSDGRSSTTVELDGAVMAAVEHAAETAPERIESACEALAADIEQEQRIGMPLRTGARAGGDRAAAARRLRDARADRDRARPRRRHHLRQPVHGAAVRVDERGAAGEELVRPVPQRARIVRVARPRRRVPLARPEHDHRPQRRPPPGRLVQRAAARRHRRRHRHSRHRPGHDRRAGRPAVAGGRRAADDGRAGDGRPDRGPGRPGGPPDVRQRVPDPAQRLDARRADRPAVHRGVRQRRRPVHEAGAAGDVPAARPRLDRPAHRRAARDRVGERRAVQRPGRAHRRGRDRP